MKLRMFGVVAAMLAVATLRPAAQSVTIKSDVLKDWTNMKETMSKIADAMPEDKFGYKPTPATHRREIVRIIATNRSRYGTRAGKLASNRRD